MKRTIKLTESKLRNMIHEAVNSAMAQCKPMRKANPKRLTENRLRAMIQESVKRALNETNIIDDMCFMVGKRRYGEFDIRDTKHFIDFSVSA